MPERLDSTEFRKLMRAPTIEGYAARHSKLSKSVTFNRDTLQSPPDGATVHSAPQSPFPAVNSTSVERSTQIGEDLQDNEHPEKEQEVEKGLQLMANNTNQVKIIKGGLFRLREHSNNPGKHDPSVLIVLYFEVLYFELSFFFLAALDDEQQYFTDILLAIKQVMNAHLQEMQDKFHHRFERLEEEIRNKEQIINRLRAHIFELERNHEESFRVGIKWRLNIILCSSISLLYCNIDLLTEYQIDLYVCYNRYVSFRYIEKISSLKNSYNRLSLLYLSSLRNFH